MRFATLAVPLSLPVVGCAADTDADTAAPVDAAAVDALPVPVQTAECPVVDYAACAGTIEGTWHFVSMCPDDQAAADALYEHPFDNLDACKPPGGTVVAKRTIDGTLIFTGGTIEFDQTGLIELTYGFDPQRLAAAKPEAASPEAACAAIPVNEKLTCTLDGETCTCDGAVESPAEQVTGTYVVDWDRLTVEDELTADFCAADDVLIIDWDQFEVSWRYWILTRDDGT